MSCLSVSLFVVALMGSTSGSTHLCSKSDSDVRCVECKGEETPFKCPKQCGGERDLRLCNGVCSSNCKRSECEFEKASEPFLRCSIGCNDFYTGPYCTQHCMEGCNRCSQDNSVCYKCERGRYGDKCNKKCDTCKDGLCAMNGTCSRGCEPGFYGEKCLKRCERCKKCGNEVSCDVCRRDNGTCINGCDYGYYGPSCELACGSRCTHCHPETGKCEQCETGFVLKKGQCKRIKELKQAKWKSNDNALVEEKTTTAATTSSKSTSIETSTEMTIGDSGVTAVTKTTHLLGVDEATVTKPDRKVSRSGDSVNDIDYLLPAVICLLVVFAATTLVLLWKLRSRFRVNSEERSDLEHKSLSKSGNTKGPLSLSRSCPLYSEIPELQAKKMAMAMSRPALLLPGDKAFPNLSRSGSTSTTYMTPVEDSEEDLFLPRTATFGFVPQCFPEKKADHWKTSTVTLDDGAISLVFENDIDNQRPFRLKPNMIGSYEIPAEYLDKNSSGRSTPRVLDM